MQMESEEAEDEKNLYVRKRRRRRRRILESNERDIFEFLSLVYKRYN